MNILYISGFLPSQFSEHLCNAKLVYALSDAGYDVDVISKPYSGPEYNAEWTDPWLQLKSHTYEVDYELGNKLERFIDIMYSSICMRIMPIDGIRWARRALAKALEMHKRKHYDAVLTRAPSDIFHIVGYRFSKMTGVKWIANWNDPAATIWPAPYTHRFSFIRQKIENAFAVKILKAADINTFPSKRLCDHFIRHYPFLKQKHNVIIPHIGLLERLMPAPLARPEYKTLRMCHSGNLSKERNPELLFAAIDGLCRQGYNIELDIMGYVNDYTASLIAKYSLGKQVRFIGSHTYIDALQIMSSYDVLVLIEAQMHEGIFFPSKFTDYVQLDRPILAISPPTGFINDMISVYGGGVCTDNTNMEAIRDGIILLYNAWCSDKLNKQFDSSRLYMNFAPQTVVDIYNRILK